MAPDRFVTVNTVEPVERARLPLESVQLPVLAVTQLPELPGAKLPLTVTLATAPFVPVSYTVTVAWACHDFVFPLPPFSVAPVDTDLIAIVWICGVATLVPKVYSSRLGEPVPGEVTRLGVALLVRIEAIAAGAAPGLACAIRAAAPAT